MSIRATHLDPMHYTALVQMTVVAVPLTSPLHSGTHGASLPKCMTSHLQETVQKGVTAINRRLPPSFVIFIKPM